jgi:hypothetical protein
MKRLFRPIVAFTMVGLLGVVGCDSSHSSTGPGIGSPSFGKIPVQSTLDGEVRSLVSTAFPKGQATAILAKWDQVLKAVDKEPKDKLKGKAVPAAAGRKELTKTIAYIQMKASEATSPAGETRDHFIARLVLDMSLYVYGGADSPVPSMSATSDVAFKVVQPANTDTVVTPAKAAAVIFPANSVSEPTVVVITPDPTYYPANCSGPLDTSLCQYPLFYHFNVFPDVKLNTPAKVQVCHVDAGTARRPLANHNRFRPAHEKPADPTYYSAGSTIVDNIEILATVTMNVTKCVEGDSTSYSPPLLGSVAPLDHMKLLAQRLTHGVTWIATKLFIPQDVYAIDVGIGGSAESFSMFGVVDPQGKADLAQSTSTSSRFQPAATSVVTGNTLSIPAWSVTNLGNATSKAFTSTVIVASDTALASPVLVTTLGGAPSLVPGATFTYAAMTIAMPSAAGSYFVGTKITPVGADSTAANDWISVRVTVSTPSLTSYSVVVAPWTAAGPGTLTATATGPHSMQFTYNFDYSESQTGFPFPTQQWVYSSTAAATGNFTFNWTYDGFHSYFNIGEALEAFAYGPGETVTAIPLASGSCPASCPPFSYSGTATLPLTSGYTWGVRPSGYNYDSARKLQGTVTISDLGSP